MLIRQDEGSIDSIYLPFSHISISSFFPAHLTPCVSRPPRSLTHDASISQPCEAVVYGPRLSHLKVVMDPSGTKQSWSEGCCLIPRRRAWPA